MLRARRCSRSEKVNCDRARAAQGDRSGTRHPHREYRALRRRACPPTMPCCGARSGMGKSSLVKAVACRGGEESQRQAEARRDPSRGYRGPAHAHDAHPRATPRFRFIVFCDDLSFDAQDTSFKSLKAALEGGIEGRPDNMIFYATSNRRHLLPRDMIENERSTAINPSRGGAGEGVAFRPLRTVARLPQLLAGRISRHGRGLRPALQARTSRPTRCMGRRSNGRSPAAAAPAASPGSSSRISGRRRLGRQRLLRAR